MTVADNLTRELLAQGPFARCAAPWCLVRVAGPDAVEFLHRLCSQDVAGLQPGQCLPAAFLDAKGKLLVSGAVLRCGAEVFLETRSDQQPRLLQLLERYHFTEQLTFGAVGEWSCAEWIGGAAGGPGAAGDASSGFVLTSTAHGVACVRVHRPAADAATALPALGAAAPLGEVAAELFYMLQGLVRVGLDSEPSTLVLEAGLEHACSTTKGCYTGQEVVARIHTYGHTNRRLCLLLLDGEGTIDAPSPLQEPDDGMVVGRVMRALPLAGRGQRLGVGYLPPDFQREGQALRLQADGSAVQVLRC
jgi:tRNA-modifying protein YgfZ